MNNFTFNTVNTSNNSFPCQFIKDSDLPRDLKTFSIFFVGACGIFGNIFIIVLAIKYTVKRNLHHLIINMAIADILVVTSMWGYRKMKHEDITCKVLRFTLSTSISVTYISLALISVERFRASRRTVRLSQPYTLKQRLLVDACSWLFAGTFGAIQILPYKTSDEQDQLNHVVYLCNQFLKTPFVIEIINAIIRLSLFCCAFSLSSVTLRRISRRQAIEASIPEIQRKAREKRKACTLKMVLSSLVLFFCAYSPFPTWEVLKTTLPRYKDLSKRNMLCSEINLIDFLAFYLPTINSCLSPVIYLIFLADFREAARKLVFRKAHPLEVERNAAQQQTSL